MVFVLRFLKNIEFPFANCVFVKLSNNLSFTVFGGVVDRFLSLTGLFVVRDLSVYFSQFIKMGSSTRLPGQQQQ